MNKDIVLYAIILVFIAFILYLTSKLYNHKCNAIDKHHSHIQIKQPHNIEIVSTTPFIMIVHGFLSLDECDHLLTISKDRFERSKVHEKEPNKVSKYRTSSTTMLKSAEDEVISTIENRASSYMHCPVKNIEPLQVVRYYPNQEFKKHYDFFVKGQEHEFEKAGQRHCTMFVYLNDVEEGGCTYFNKINVKIKPKKGVGVFWLNQTLDGKEDYLTEHCGEPPVRGTKYGLNIWSRTKPFPK